MPTGIAKSPQEKSRKLKEFQLNRRLAYKKESKKCPTCGVEYFKNNSNKYTRQDWSKRKFCSLKCVWRGRKRSEENKTKISISKKGRIPYKMTEEVRKKMSKAKRGVKFTDEHKKSISLNRKGISSGAKNYRWITDRTEALNKRLIRNSRDWKDWRITVFERDSYTCQDCGISGVYIEAHHIIPIRLDKTKIFELKNGITLCRPCHQKTIWKETNFIEKYTQIVSLVNHNFKY